MAELYLLLHILVLVYWLGGDLGAFYASRVVVNSKEPAAGRFVAGKILMGVDMAPRMGLIFAFPTGLALAITRGWLELDLIWIAPAFGAATVWAWLAWTIHARTGTRSWQGRMDIAIRWVSMGALTGSGLAALVGRLDLPLFLALKLVLLGFAIACGLMIRRALVPFGPAFSVVSAGQGDGEADRIISASMAHAKRYVLAIWAALLAAAALGVWTPASF